MKLKRKGGLTAGIITLSAVALTSVGFAAWVISAGDVTSVTGDIKVDTVDDDSHTIFGVYDKAAGIEATTDHSLANIKAGVSTQKIQFGANKNTARDSSELAASWLSTNNATDFENLSVTYYVCVLNGSVAVNGLTVANYIKAGFSVINPEEPTHADAPLADYSGYGGAQSLGLVGATHTVEVTRLGAIENNGSPEASSLLETIEDNIETPSTARRTWYSVVVNFSWGSLWNGNPYDYYNAKASNAEVYDMGYAAWEAGHSYSVGDIVTIESESKSYKCKTANSDASFTVANWDEYKISASAHANKYLTALNKLLTGVSYKFTFKTYANSTEKGNDNAFETNNAANIVVDDAE